MNKCLECGEPIKDFTCCDRCAARLLEKKSEQRERNKTHG